MTRCWAPNFDGFVLEFYEMLGISCGYIFIDIYLGEGKWSGSDGWLENTAKKGLSRGRLSLLRWFGRGSVVRGERYENRIR